MPTTHQNTKEVFARWSAYEHLHQEKGLDWYWALGIIATSASLTSILFGNVLFALVIVVAAIVLGMMARQAPEIVEFTITELGIRTGDTLHKYDSINAFWVEEGDENTSALLVDTNKALAPHLVIPLSDETDPNDVREILRNFIHEEPLSEPLPHKILEFLGF